MAQEATKKEGKELVKSLIARWKRISDDAGESDNRKRMREEKLFAAGDQWPESVRKDREADDRPCVTINRIQQMIKQVVNDMRQNRAGLRVHPTSGGAREQVAEIRAGLIRAIEAKSAASQAYIQAADDAVRAQIGYLRILPKYEDDASFNQELSVEWIQDSLSVYYGDYKKPDGSDAQECYVLTRIPRDQFKREYPKAEEVPFPSDFAEAADWCGEDDITIGETYNIEYGKSDTLYLLQDGTTVLRSALPGEPPEGMVLKERSISKPELVCRKITAVEVLEEARYPVPYLFIIPVIGEEFVLEGKRHRLSLTRHGMDPQRVYNYARTATTEQVALAPRAPWVMAEGQAEGHEDEWGQANSKNLAYLTYKPQSIAGQLVGAPQRQAFAGTPAGALSDLQLASEEIKAVTGIYDASLGASGNETSGKAILARQREADNATFHYVDNLNRAILQVGVVLNELLPFFYDTERIVRIIGDDGVESLAKLNGLGGIDLGSGRYDVVLDVGPSYETKRIEATNSMTAFMQAVPNAAPLMADELARNMDWPGARRIAERLKLLLPPEVQAAEGGAPQIPPEMQAQMEEMGQVIQQLQQALQEKLQENEQLQQQAGNEEARQMLELRKVEVQDYEAKTERLRTLYEAANAQPLDEKEPSQELVSALMEEIQSLRAEVAQSLAQPAEAVEPQAPVPQIVHVMQQAAPKPPRRELRIVAPSGTVYEGVVLESADGDTTVSLAEVPNAGGIESASCFPQ